MCSKGVCRKDKFMAKNLNKSRMRDSRAAILAVLFAAFFTKALIPYETPMHEGL